jgi:large subunit ribosomal protein L4
VAFGPRTRSYKQAMPKKMRRLALKCVLSAKVSDGELLVVDSFGLKQPRTRQVVDMLQALGVASSALLVSAEPDVNFIKSARNIEGSKTLPAGMLNVVDLLSHRMLLMTVDAVRRVEDIWGKKEQLAEARVS